MEIDSLITRAVLTVSEGDSLRDTAVWMIERGVGSAVVLTDGKPSGIVTDRDALRAIARGKDASALTVGDLLPGKLTTVLPSLEVLEAARLMRDRGFRHLVVVDEAGDLAGVFSMRDLVVGLLAERNAERAGASSQGP
ncbi:MAG TPA: CBS domain-containing protein [Acidimicrobiales bacterium]|nr:CBS domain-containing protein [Acidimicrobiales bacterium]